MVLWNHSDKEVRVRFNPHLSTVEVQSQGIFLHIYCVFVATYCCNTDCSGNISF